LSFETFGFTAAINKAITESGYKTPTEIQKKSIPEILLNKHILASAQTGTGKTAAFVLPILELLLKDKNKVRGPRVLIVSPTRELANQITDSVKKYARYTNINSATVVGGMSYKLQNKLLSKPLDILIATPGRLLDLFKQGKIKFKDTKIMVLDEADKMLDMGFVPDIRKIFNATTKQQQMLMFSATLDNAVSKIASEFLTNPLTISIKPDTKGHSNIQQSLYYVDNQLHKQNLLKHFLADQNLNQAIIFTATKRQADKLTDDLYHSDFKTAALHGDMSQGSRTKTINRFKRNEIKVLVATDLASRGIDVKDITHVFNYDMPRFAEDYIHRIGRTGRANKKGLALSFVSPTDREHLKKIERFTGMKIEIKVIAGMEPTRKASEHTEKKKRGGGSFFNKSKRGFDKSKKTFKNRANAKKRIHKKPAASA
jgi:superfamily II DNA/RNA helicase|tara:strand:+ start:107 stop:1390 length:1284 start_codon:yes stop_codon:yes gene_type:complete